MDRLNRGDVIAGFLNKFYEFTEDAIARHLRLGLRGDLYCWIDTTGATLEFRASAEPPAQEDFSRFNVRKYDLSDETEVQQFLRLREEQRWG